MSAGPARTPTLGDLGGRSVVLAYGSVAAEYEALHAGAAMFDRSHRGRVRLTGDRAGEMVAGLVTNDVSGLLPGQGCYAAALTPKGKIISDVRVFVEETSVLVDAPPRAAAAWLAMVKKFVNPRLAPHADESGTMSDLGIFGVNARHVVATLTGVPAPALTALVPYAHLTIDVHGQRVLVVRSPDLGFEGFDVLAPTSLFAGFWDGAAAAGAVPAGLEAWEIARVEAGRPEWGVDMDDTTIPQEANFDELHAISYTKGCYVGQETVARVHFRGHVNKHLRGIRARELDAPPTGATLHDEAGQLVGDVRSTVRSPRLGGIAIAMIRREVAAGTSLRARWRADGGGGEGASDDASLAEASVDVTDLPFAAD